MSIACFLLIFQFVSHELSYDEYHPHADRVYRISEKLSEETIWVPGSGKLIESLVPHLPEIEKVVRFNPDWKNSHHLAYGEKAFFEPLKSFYWTEETVLSVFDIELILGDPAHAFTGPGDLLISETAARKYFGDASPLGQTLRKEKKTNLVVKGVFRDLPGNTHLKFDFLAWTDNLQNSWSYTYFQLFEPIPTADLEARLNAELKKHRPDHTGTSIVVVPLTDIHLDSKFDYETEPVGSHTNVSALAAIGVLILLMGCMNFMNLSTARASLRGKEVGVRKAIGSSRYQLIAQFLVESFLLTFISVGLAIALAAFAWQVFEALSGRDMVEPSLTRVLWVAGSLTVILTLLAGSYPAFLLSSFQTIKVLKGQTKTGKGALGVRKLLVTLQFMVSIFLLAGVMVVYLQLRFFNEKSLGFEKDQLVAIVGDNGSNDLSAAEVESITNEWRQHPNVIHVGKSRGVPTKLDWINYDRFFIEGSPENEDRRAIINRVDHDFSRSMGLEVIKGRAFSREEDGAAQDRILINESFAKLTGWEDPVGKKLDFIWTQRQSAIVVGVLRDHHTQSLHEPVSPQIFWLSNATDYFYWTVRLGKGDVLETINHLDQVWSQFLDRPFDHFFVDEAFNGQYASDQRFARVLGIFTLLAVLVAALGLFALTMFTVQLRLREISVRKVLGASVRRIFLLLSGGFSKLIFIAFLVASPIAFLVMNQWLNGFAYRIAIPWWVFALVGLLGIVLALISTLWHSLRAAMVNPAQILRSE